MGNYDIRQKLDLLMHRRAEWLLSEEITSPINGAASMRELMSMIECIHKSQDFRTFDSIMENRAAEYVLWLNRKPPYSENLRKYLGSRSAMWGWQTMGMYMDELEADIENEVMSLVGMYAASGGIDVEDMYRKINVQDSRAYKLIVDHVIRNFLADDVRLVIDQHNRFLLKPKEVYAIVPVRSTMITTTA